MASLMTAAGEFRPCTGYLMGKPRRRRGDLLAGPAMLLYAPLRWLIYIDYRDRTRLAAEQSSTVFASFADPVIA